MKDYCDYDALTLCKRIRELRKERDFSQKNLAQEIGVAQNTIAQYENGTAKPSLEVLFKLAIALSTTADYLLGLSDW